MDVAAFDYHLPPELIAQHPAPAREAARLLVVDRASGNRTHATVSALPEHLRAGDVLVVNDTAVFPARLIGQRVPTGGSVECLLLERVEGGHRDDQRWEALVHPGQKLRPGGRIRFSAPGATLHGEVLEWKFFGRRLVRLWTDDGRTVDEAVDAIGHVPLPPYIKRPDAPDDRDRYQTMFARVRGSAAAPTAGLHFTPGLRDRLRSAGVEIAEITLHVSYGTFKPVRVERVEDHTVDPEWFEIREDAATTINRALQENRRIIAVGTTTTRALESSASGPRPPAAFLTARGAPPPRARASRIRARRGPRALPRHVEAGAARTDLFICPGYEFRVIGGLLTNFHLPRSSLLMLVCAFGGREEVLAAYRDAVARGYRFYSYGEAMLIL